MGVGVLGGGGGKRAKLFGGGGGGARGPFFSLAVN